MLADTGRLKELGERHAGTTRDFHDAGGLIERCGARILEDLICLRRRNARCGCSREYAIGLTFAVTEDCGFVVVVELKRSRERTEPLERVVLSYGKPELGSRCEKTIRLIDSARDEVIHQHPDVRRLPPENQRLSLLNAQTRIDSCKHTLAGSLLISGGTVDLPGEIQSWDRLHLKRRVELSGRVVIVFDRVSSAVHAHVLETGHRAHYLELNLGRQRGGQSVDVKLARVMSLWLEEKLVTLGIRKPYNLVLDGRTVPRSPCRYRPAVHR